MRYKVFFWAGVLAASVTFFQNCSDFQAPAKSSPKAMASEDAAPSAAGLKPRPASIAAKYAGQSPAIFYIPHQDDEALGFAAAAVEHKLAGHPVFYVLISKGNDEHLHSTMNGGKDCFINQSWMTSIWDRFPSFNLSRLWSAHETRHPLGLSMAQIVQGRNAEFLASAAQAGVDEVFFINNGEGIDDGEFYTDYPGSITKVRRVIEELHARFPNASHKFPSGLKDYMFNGATWERNATHMAIHQAALDARAALSLPDTRFYRIYAYWDPAGNAGQVPWSFTQTIAPEWMAGKRRALDEYKKWDPANGRYALGYHSVPTLIDLAYTDEMHYFDDP